MDRNIKLIAAYDGTDFCGWQRQESERTVQGVIEDALEKMHGHPVNLTGSGRTDSGVHAVGQAANFYTDIESIPADRFAPALNSSLPQEIRVLASCEADKEFHARFSAKARIYRYQFMCRPLLPHESRYNLHLRRFPRLELLNEYGRLLLEKQTALFLPERETQAPQKTAMFTEPAFILKKTRLFLKFALTPSFATWFARSPEHSFTTKKQARRLKNCVK